MNENICEKLEALIRDKEAAFKAAAAAEIAYGTADTMEDRARTGGAYEEAMGAASVALHRLNDAMAAAVPQLLAQARQVETLQTEVVELKSQRDEWKQTAREGRESLSALRAELEELQARVALRQRLASDRVLLGSVR